MNEGICIPPLASSDLRREYTAPPPPPPPRFARVRRFGAHAGGEETRPPCFERGEGGSRAARVRQVRRPRGMIHFQNGAPVHRPSIRMPTSWWRTNRSLPQFLARSTPRLFLHPHFNGLDLPGLCVYMIISPLDLLSFSNFRLIIHATKSKNRSFLFLFKELRILKL